MSDKRCCGTCAHYNGYCCLLPWQDAFERGVPACYHLVREDTKPTDGGDCEYWNERDKTK